MAPPVVLGDGSETMALVAGFSTTTQAPPSITMRTSLFNTSCAWPKLAAVRIEQEARSRVLFMTGSKIGPCPRKATPRREKIGRSGVPTGEVLFMGV